MQRRQGCQAILMEFLGSHVQVRKRLNRGALRDLAGPWTLGSAQFTCSSVVFTHESQAYPNQVKVEAQADRTL